MKISQLTQKLNLSIISKHSVKIGIIVFVALSGYLAYDYYSTQKELSEYTSNTDLQALKEKNDLLKTLGKMTVLPQNEEPTIATVSDAFRLRGQKFFARAENGDRVVIYKSAQRAILYRPSAKKIVEAAPINLSDVNTESVDQVADANQSSSANYVLGDSEKRAEVSKPNDPAKLAVYNGTLSTGLASKLATYLKTETGENAVTTPKIENADGTYDETIIIDITGKYGDIFSKIKDLLDAKIVEKPSGSNYPDVDIVVIAGKNLDLEKIK